MLAPLTRLTGNPALGALVCAAWAAGICYLSGLRGFFAMDQSIVFDGAWRIDQGQVPYRDFLIPFGPMSMWLQAAAFALGGVSYQVYVLTAAAMNALGALFAFATLRILAPEKPGIAWAAGLITGSWLYAPMGTTYLEQTAFFWIWIVIFCVVRGLFTPPAGPRSFWMAGAGLALAAAVLSKTNAGGLAVPIAFLMVLLVPAGPARRPWTDAAALALGLVAGAAVFSFWLWTKSDPGVFWQIVGGAGGEEGRKRLLQNKPLMTVFGSLLTGKGNDLIRLLLVGSYLFMGVALAFALGPVRRAGRAAGRLPSCAWLGLLWVGYQQAFGVTSNNNGINEQPFLSLILVSVFLAAGDLHQLSRKMGAREVRAFWWKSGSFLLLAGGLVTALLASRGIHGLGNYNFVLGAILALSLLSLVLAPDRPGFPPMRAGAWIGAAVGAVVFAIGAWGSYFRQAQDFFNFGTRYVRGEGIPGLRGLAWADGVNRNALPMHPSWEQMVELYQLLRQSPGRFHLLGHYTIFYALTGRPNIGPVSYFYRGLTFPSAYDPEYDQNFTARIDHPDVVYFILEDPADHNGLLADLPQVRAVLDKKYRFVKTIGIFQVYRRLEGEAGFRAELSR